MRGRLSFHYTYWAETPVRARVGQGYLNTSQTVLKSLRSVDLFDRLWRGAS